MLLRADPTTNTLSLLSFPRDLYVNIYCHGDTVYTQDRINSAWGTCGNNGPAATLDTIQHLTGLKINYFITLDFHAFKQLVNNLHGVYMNVDRRYYIPLHTGVSAVNLQPGYQKLDGGQALSYVRYRHTDSDIYRTGRQQLFIEALKSRLRSGPLTVEDPARGSEARRCAQAQHRDRQGGRWRGRLQRAHEVPRPPVPPAAGPSLPQRDPAQRLPLLRDLGRRRRGVGLAEAIAGAVHSFLNPDVRDAQAVNTQFGGKPKTPKKKTKVHKLPKSQVSVLVLNAGTVAGQAVETNYLLSRRGYTTSELPSGDQANAPKVQRDTVIYWDPAQPDAQEAAQQLLPLFGAHTRVAQMTTTIADIGKLAGNPLTVVAVGTSFPGKLVVHKPPKVQPKVPPQVSDGAGMTAPRLRQIYDEVHFPLMVPHKIAAGAVLSDSEGVRGFRPLKSQHEVALTFVMRDRSSTGRSRRAPGTRRRSSPNPSFTLIHKGQKYLVYTTGGQIQMVALRTPRATYWVSNTILNELSNSTMLAIAESLRPLRR